MIPSSNLSDYYWHVLFLFIVYHVNHYTHLFSKSPHAQPYTQTGTATCTPAHIATVTPTNTIASPQGQRTTDADATWGRGRVVTGLRLLSAAAEHAANAAAADHNAFRALVETLQRCLCCDGGVGLGDGCSEADVRLEAVRALGSVVVSCPRPSDQEALGSCLSHLLQAIQGWCLYRVIPMRSTN